MAECEVKTQARGKPFPLGQSGNPNGRPPISRWAAASIIGNASGRVARKVVAAALAGDLEAARLVLEFGLASACSDAAALGGAAPAHSNGGAA